jgi:hypothetical protein
LTETLLSSETNAAITLSSLLREIGMNPPPLPPPLLSLSLQEPSLSEDRKPFFHSPSPPLFFLFPKKEGLVRGG